MLGIFSSTSWILKGLFSDSYWRIFCDFFYLKGKVFKAKKVTKYPSIGIWKQALFLGVFEAIDEGEDVSVKFYNDWVENVKNYVPKDRLLVFDVKEGWNPLCKFLEVPVPNAPFPWENDTAELRGRFNKVKWASYLIIVGPGCLFFQP